MPLPVAGGEVAPAAGHVLRVEATPRTDAGRRWSLRWQRPSPSDPVGWEAVLTLAQAGPLAELSCVVRQLAGRKPSDPALRSPSVVRAAVQKLSCSAGGVPLQVEPRSLAAGSIPRFVEEVLCSGERVLPVLLLCRGEPEVATSLEPATLADRVAGLAHLWLLHDERAACALAEAVGDELACPPGTARLYQPGFRPGAASVAHPRFEARAGARSPTPLDQILERLSTDAAERVGPGSSTGEAGEARRAGAPAPRARSRARKPEVTAAPAPQVQVAPAPVLPPDQTLLERIVAENEALARRKRDLEHETLELELEIERTQEAIAASSALLEATRVSLASRPGGEASAGAGEPELASVAEAVALAKLRFAGRLLFLASAEASAAASPFQNARRAFEALTAVDEIAGLRRASIAYRTSVGSMEALFQARGFLYKAHESMTARGRWGEEYQVVFEGRKESIEEHVAIGTGGPESCLRIHFFWDPGSMRFVLAHVGRHKTNTRS